MSYFKIQTFNKMIKFKNNLSFLFKYRSFVKKQ